MTGIVIFNVLMIALGTAAGFGVISQNRLSDMLDWLHGIIGITPPPSERARLYTLIWIGSMTAIVDGLLFMLVFLAMRVIRS